MGRARRRFSRSSATLFSPTHRNSGIAAALSVAQVSWFAAAPGAKPFITSGVPARWRIASSRLEERLGGFAQMQPRQLLTRKYMPRGLKFGRPIKRTDMEMRFGRQARAFAGQC